MIMNQGFKNLFSMMKALVRNGGTAKAACELDCLPLPWDSWTLISLIRQRERQTWACHVVQERLNLEKGDGLVPGLPEWEYWFHGKGCQLKHRVTGECIETETGDGFDFYFWLRYLQSLKNPDPATRRMVTLHPSLKSLRITLADLSEAGVIDSCGSEAVGCFNLSEEVVDHAETVDQFCRLLADEPTRLRASEAIGDPDTGPNRQERLARALGRLRGVNSEV
jgi:hypothetical protein